MRSSSDPSSVDSVWWRGATPPSETKWAALFYLMARPSTAKCLTTITTSGTKPEKLFIDVLFTQLTYSHHRQPTLVSGNNIYHLLLYLCRVKRKRCSHFKCSTVIFKNCLIVISCYSFASKIWNETQKAGEKSAGWDPQSPLQTGIFTGHPAVDWTLGRSHLDTG